MSDSLLTLSTTPKSTRASFGKSTAGASDSTGFEKIFADAKSSNNTKSALPNSRSSDSQNASQPDTNATSNREPSRSTRDDESSVAETASSQKATQVEKANSTDALESQKPTKSDSKEARASDETTAHEEKTDSQLESPSEVVVSESSVMSSEANMEGGNKLHTVASESAVDGDDSADIDNLAASIAVVEESVPPAELADNAVSGLEDGSENGIEGDITVSVSNIEIDSVTSAVANEQVVDKQAVGASIVSPNTDNLEQTLLSESDNDTQLDSKQNNLSWVLQQLGQRSSTQQSNGASDVLGNAGIVGGALGSASTSSTLSSSPAGAMISVTSESLLTVTENGMVMDDVLDLDALVTPSPTTLATSAALSTASSSSAQTQATPTLSMSVSPQSGAWPLEMAQKVSWVVSEGVKTAHIQLDPPELGSLTIKVSIDQDGNTQVGFTAANNQARDVIESQLQRLREMLSQQGVDVDTVDVNVAQDNRANEGQEQGAQSGSGSKSAGAEEEDSDMTTSYVDPNDRGIDFYA